MRSATQTRSRALRVRRRRETAGQHVRGDRLAMPGLRGDAKASRRGPSPVLVHQPRNPIVPAPHCLV